MALQDAGSTQHFTIRYDNAIGPNALSVANAVKNICESDLAKLTVYMPSHPVGGDDPFLDPRRIDVQIINDSSKGPGFGGGENYGVPGDKAPVIQINPFSAMNTQITDDYAGLVFVAELSELLMSFYNWDASSSQGEALSIVMADELHPNTLNNRVNKWLSIPRPRPDFINRNEKTGGFVRADQDETAYGCGIIFIYFLRYQLNLSYDKICRDKSETLADRYRNLTGFTDNPADRVSKLLDDHFGTGKINLSSNNPFPLLDGSDRKVFLAFDRETRTNFLLPLLSGIASIRPFFTCPIAKYHYDIYGSYVTRSITATTLGIGAPTFTWRINGKLLSGTSTGASVSAIVDMPDPGNPGEASRHTKDFKFDYSITSSSNVAGGSTLTLTSRTVDGDYQLDISVEAQETAVSSGMVSVTQRIEERTSFVVYKGTYEEDKRRCIAAFERVIAGKLPQLQDPLATLHNLPDPPPPGYLGAVLESAQRIREQLEHFAETDHKMASQVARYLSNIVGAPAHVFLKGARSRGSTQ